MQGYQLLNQPEFSDVRKAHDFLEVLNRDGMVAGYMDEIKEPEPTDEPMGLARRNQDRAPYMIRIGQEITLAGLEDCSFVTTTYRLRETVVGKIGVIGPKRMNYGRIVSQINFIRRTLVDSARAIRESTDTEE